MFFESTPVQLFSFPLFLNAKTSFALQTYLLLTLDNSLRFCFAHKEEEEEERWSQTSLDQVVVGARMFDEDDNNIYIIIPQSRLNMIASSFYLHFSHLTCKHYKYTHTPFALLNLYLFWSRCHENICSKMKSLIKA